MSRVLKAMLVFGVLIVSACILVACGNKAPVKATKDTTSKETSITVSTETSANSGTSSGSGASTGAETSTGSGASTDGNGSKNTGSAKSTGSKKKIASSSLLTDETTGKGAISFGDSVEKVKRVLAGYQTDAGSSIGDYNKTQYGVFFLFGDVNYVFDTNGKLIEYYSGTGWGSFETSKGLKIGDPISKAISLYGKKYSFNKGNEDDLPSYTFTFKGTYLRVEVDPQSKVDSMTCGVRQ